MFLGNQTKPFLCLLILLSACSARKTPQHNEAILWGLGQASWYGHPFHGRTTASGAVFDKYSYSAAHRYLPLLSVVRATNLANNKSVVVIINDRGPYCGKRILDLSEKAAIEIDFKNQGLTQIKLEVLPQQSKQLLQLAQSKNPKVICNYFEKHHALFQ